MEAFQEEVVRYWTCKCCRVRFLDPGLRLAADEEKKRYQTHNNLVADLAYQNFLKPLFLRMRERVAPPAQGLDYGAGPGPALAHLFEADHFPKVALYDPFFWPDSAVLNKQYDFVVTSEVVEHFHHPNQEFKRLFNLLKPGAWLGVMTLLLTEQTDFATWYYRRDPTHVVFYTSDTFRFIATQFGFEQLTYYGERIVLLRRPTAP